jgi:hypothetical protein
MKSLHDRAWDLIEAAAPTKFERSTACFLYATAAHTALRGTGAKLCAGGAFLPSSGITGWGCSVDPTTMQFWITADQEVDEDGSYCGHCWVELGIYDAVVIDIMEGYVGPRQVCDRTKPVVYHHLPKLITAIRRHHGPIMKAVAQTVAKDRNFCAAIRAAANL